MDNIKELTVKIEDAFQNELTLESLNELKVIYPSLLLLLGYRGWRGQDASVQE